MALPRSCGGNTETTMAVPTDWPMALPTAMTTRATMRSSKVGAIATKMAPPANSASPMRWTRFQPIMSASRPMGIISAQMVSPWAITTQDTAPSVTPKSSAIAASATNTMDMLMTMVTNEIAMTPNARHLWASSNVGSAGSAASGGVIADRYCGMCGARASVQFSRTRREIGKRGK